MNQIEVLNKVIEICRDIFNNDNLIITEATSSENTEEWDSLTHLNIISDLEDEFNIAFTLDEIANMKSIGQLSKAVINHLAS